MEKENTILKLGIYCYSKLSTCTRADRGEWGWVGTL